MSTKQDKLGFFIKNSDVVSNIFIPKYYNPDIEKKIQDMQKTHDLVQLGDLIETGEISVESGHEIGKMAYGTGSIPFVRTSDISNWEVKDDPKHGVSEKIYLEYSKKQNVEINDLLFVRDGTYLIGEIGIVTRKDVPLLYQSHILRIKVRKNSRVSPISLLAILSSKIVKEQIRAKQFTADIIDTIGNRYKEVVLPIPKSKPLMKKVESEVVSLIEERTKLRETLEKLPYYAEGLVDKFDSESPKVGDTPETNDFGFIMSYSKILNNIFIPKYYSNQQSNNKKIEKTHDLVTIGELVEKGIIQWSTGVEIGKMAYGTGDIPFIRTSDISNWEIKSEPKQGVSEEIYDNWKNRQDVKDKDIFIVRDGTYLVGTNCMVTKNDMKSLFCGGIYKFRSLDEGKLDPFLFLVLLNTPFVKKQIKSKKFTRDIIDTLGKRIFEIELPIPKDSAKRKEISVYARNCLTQRMKLREDVDRIVGEIENIN